jgi:effector-binding domain-containing protein
MIDTPRFVQSVAQQTAFIHLTIPRSEMQDMIGPAIGELFSTLAEQGIAPAGSLFSYHLAMDPETFDFRISVPVAQPVAASGRVEPGELPARSVARTIYHGPYEGLGAAWGEFHAWIEANGHKPAADLWECYAAGPESSPDPANWRTELNQPLTG